MTVNEEFEPNHLGRVTCLHINYDGTKILTGSIDHRIKVWTVSPQTQERSLIETFTAHDADIRDAKWLHPSTGTHLGTVGNDLKFHLFGEDPSQAPNSGRRFRKIYTINSSTRVPFVSIDFRNVDNVYTYLAVIDRQGLLSVYEPTNPDEFKDWTLVDRWNVALPVPNRGDLTCFRVRWDQNVMPLPYVCGMSDDRRQLSLIVTAGNEVKIYRGITPENEKSLDREGTGDGEATHRIKFYEAAKLPSHPALIRDVQWAPFNVRGTDLFATACKDGGVRIFEMSVTEPHDSHGHGGRTDTSTSNTTTPNKAPYASTTRQQSQSSTLTSAITGHRPQQSAQSPTTTVSSTAAASSSTVMSPNTSSARYAAPRTTFTFPYTHTITLVANLEKAHDDAWSLSWDPNGQVLVSGGADGSTKIWRRSVLDMNVNGGSNGAASGLGSGSGVGGKWMLFADQAVSLGEERSDSEDDE